MNLSEVEAQLAEIDDQVNVLASRVRGLYASLFPDAVPTELTCEQCGQPFEPVELRPNGAPAAHAFCGVRCGQAWLQGRPTTLAEPK